MSARSRLLLWLRGELGQTPAKRHVVALETGEKRAMTVAQFAEEVVRSVNTSLGKPLEEMNEGDVQTAVGLGQLHCIVPGCRFRAMAYSKAADPTGRVRYLPVCVNHGEWLIHEAPRYLSEKYGRPVEAKVEQFTEPAPWARQAGQPVRPAPDLPQLLRHRARTAPRPVASRRRARHPRRSRRWLLTPRPG
jgi:hypothetical protein